MLGYLINFPSPILALPKTCRTLRIASRELVSAMTTEVTAPIEDGPRALKHPAISFEFFPPKTEEMEKNLWETIKRLKPLTPSFVSVTYGAGGSTRERTHSTIARILTETTLLPAAHLTCVGAARGEIDEIVSRYHEIGVRHIVALRGDPPGGSPRRATMWRTPIS